ncbi:nitronate monooxygenase [Rhodococcus pseudokoreensis]|uniref:Nitronate monooxygenase n=1 Tax=Rhodococcus pseudokoreensis TaxID=2811421 RepID=A0A974W844_9NOCA|nr:nitronate monooxygenase [Rhodococcus pseudokoreensis]QSE92447.1 nitronate monooxygenase [Rhodococcus pseudokoreensis]
MNLALHTTICDRFRAEVPIFGFAHSLEVVAAVTEAGGIGIWGATRNTPEEIIDGLAWLRDRLGDAPFGIDLVLPSGMPERDDRAALEAQIPNHHTSFVASLRAKYGVPDDGLPGTRSRFVRSQQMADRQLRAVLDSEVPILAMGVGSPAAAVQGAKDRGKCVVALVGAPKHARSAVESGADILVAQGYDAGAHTGEIGTFSLAPQIIAQAGDVPVVVAGGVGCGSQVAAALALGAVGVWLGTAWLFTKEHATHPVVLDKLIRASSSDTTRLRADSGKTLRQIKTAWSDEWERPTAPTPLKMPYQDILVGDFLGAVERHEIEPLLKSEAGQSVGFFNELTTVADVIARLTGEADDALAALTRRSSVQV